VLDSTADFDTAARVQVWFARQRAGVVPVKRGFHKRRNATQRNTTHQIQRGNATQEF